MLLLLPVCAALALLQAAAAEKLDPWPGNTGQVANSNDYWWTNGANNVFDNAAAHPQGTTFAVNRVSSASSSQPGGTFVQRTVVTSSSPGGVGSVHRSVSSAGGAGGRPLVSRFNKVSSSVPAVSGQYVPPPRANSFASAASGQSGAFVSVSQPSVPSLTGGYVPPPPSSGVSSPSISRPVVTSPAVNPRPVHTSSSSQTQFRPSGSVSQTQFRPSGSVSQTQFRPSGSGSQTQFRPSGSGSQTQFRPSGSHIQSRPSGSQIQPRPSGSSTQFRPSGVGSQTGFVGQPAAVGNVAAEAPSNLSPVVKSCGASLFCVPDTRCDPYTGFLMDGAGPIPQLDQPRVAFTRCYQTQSRSVGVCCQEPHINDPWTDRPPTGVGGQQGFGGAGSAPSGTFVNQQPARQNYNW